jgi:hypothetical protein
MNDTAIRKDKVKLGFVGLGLMGSRFLKRLHAEAGTSVAGVEAKQRLLA